MRKYNPEKYIKLVENTNNPLLKQFMEDEKQFVLNINDLQSKTIIDLGAGHGRAINFIKNNFFSYYGIEINEEMYSYLKSNESQYSGVKTINGDITCLRKILEEYEINFDNVLFLLLQNTIGTIEGETQHLLNELRHIMSNNNSELVISFFKSNKLPTLGFEMFCELEEMVGIADKQLCDFSNGIFRSQLGYEAKWWNSIEIKSVLNQIGVKTFSKIDREAYCIYHLK